MKRTVIILYMALVAIMAVATIGEHFRGTAWVSDSIYGAWWFTALWALLIAAAILYFLRRRVRRPSTVALHLSFVIILTGALLTYLTAWSGRIHIRQGEAVHSCFVLDGEEIRVRPLPFAIALQDFHVDYYAGTDAPSDYVTRFVITDGDCHTVATVSMNHIYTHSHLRLSQCSYDTDLQGSTLAVNYDPWGIPVTYSGYALLFMGLLWILADPHGTFRQILRQMPSGKNKSSKSIKIIGVFVALGAFVLLTYHLVQRWNLMGTVPLTNAYETMLFLAWCVLLVSLLLWRRIPFLTILGLLFAGFCVLATHLLHMDSEVMPVMPVLNSPLLALHVSVIMLAYALLSLAFLCGLTYLLLSFITQHSSPLGIHLTSLSQLFLYPAMTCLGMGIFIGAIWANISWGNYWSWDPKETWALITFMTYAVALHPASLPWLRRPVAFHAYIVLAFFTLLMTYFGVSYLLGGMHSYA